METYEIFRKVNGNVKELITGTLTQIYHRYSVAIDQVTANQKPENITALLDALNTAQTIKSTVKGKAANKITYELK
jgi:hypothetical protein